ncbi:LacI family transcriptional regulator [candidate division KSB3 bacterium]|uniref:LacI family transcriptional regulator n=1 Tax=candidate division KSB3 bacterium TaxID=2044937 RepID=A0A2G6E496_9BACT|nr:MAG: LacI family transcriptional regulator [candidate division KSB3 bacterium]PIE29438.1 MAG: LacI family transcriptional regulator [candidate division KSB3 bacterium]
MAVTLKDIAKRAGVSATTVSLVLNQGSNSRISEDTQNKILHIAKELGYHSSKAVPNSPLTVPPAIGLVFTDITNPFFTALAGVIEDVASRYGYNIILCNTQRNLKKEQEYLHVLIRRRIDGLIIAPVDVQESNVEDFIAQNIPVVFIDRFISSQRKRHAVLVDNVKGAFVATEHLLSLGHRRIGIINGRRNVSTGQDRLTGYIDALQTYAVSVDEDLVADGLFTVEEGQEATKILLDLSRPPTAIFCSGGVMTVGALLEMKDRGMTLPRDLSFISFDDEKWCTLIDPPLTVVAQPTNTIGAEAAQMVIQLIQGWGTEESQQIVLEPQLIIRESCAPYMEN